MEFGASCDRMIVSIIPESNKMFTGELRINLVLVRAF